MATHTYLSGEGRGRLKELVEAGRDKAVDLCNDRLAF